MSVIQLCAILTNNLSCGGHDRFQYLQLDVVVQNLKEKLDSKQKEAAAWKAKYNIKTQEEVEAASRQ